jgi:hypothetical protein
LLLLHVEALDLELALLRETLALQGVARVLRSRGRRARWAPELILALELLLLEHLLLDALLQLELAEPALVSRRQVVTARADALLQLKIERVLLLLNLQLAAIACGTLRMRICSEREKRQQRECAYEGKQT